MRVERDHLWRLSLNALGFGVPKACSLTLKALQVAMVRTALSYDHASSFSSSSLLLSILNLSDPTIYEPQVRALLGPALHFC